MPNVNLKIAHRINTIAQLRDVPSQYGVEIDLRSEGKNLILHHDPFAEGESFEEYLKAYQHAFVVLNVKTEGIEEEILRLLKKFQIHNYFFLDLSLPFLVKYAKKGERNIAVRFSEFEPIEFVLKFKGLVDWVWVDCFSKFPLDDAAYKALKPYFKLCLVSPELQGHPVEKIEEFKQYIKDKEVDAVCTKRPELW